MRRVQRAGVGAALMAEQLAFDKPARNRRTVQCDEWPVLARALVVNRSGNEFLARSGLSLNQNSGVGWSHHADCVQGSPEAHAGADQFVLGPRSPVPEAWHRARYSSHHR